MSNYVENFTTNSFGTWEAWVSTLILCIIAYLIGSINTGQIFSRKKKQDLGSIGSKNYGATNAGRTFGKKYFAFIFAGDFLKPIILGLLFTVLLKYTEFFQYSAITVSLFFCYIGQIWPIWFKFKGGKGIATAYGVFTIINWIFALIGGIFFLIFFYFSKKVWIGSIGSMGIVVLCMCFQPGYPEILVFDWAQTWTSILVAFSMWFISIYRHKDNIRESYQDWKNKKEVNALNTTSNNFK